jgi:hypothetical protein
MNNREMRNAIQAAEDRLVAMASKTNPAEPLVAGDVLAEITGTTEPPSPDTAQWHHYDAEAIAYAADDRIEYLTTRRDELVMIGRALASGDGNYPDHVQDDTARRLHRDRVAAEITGLSVAIDLLVGVRCDAARDIPRQAEPHHRRVPSVSNLSAVELIALDLNRLNYPPQERPEP